MGKIQMEQKNSNSVRVHRVGSITAGASMVLWGVLFILYELRVIAELNIVLKLWPLILVGLGTEILWYNAKEDNLIYDKGAVLMMAIMSAFSMLMAMADRFMTYLGHGL